MPRATSLTLRSVPRLRLRQFSHPSAGNRTSEPPDSIQSRCHPVETVPESLTHQPRRPHHWVPELSDQAIHRCPSRRCGRDQTRPRYPLTDQRAPSTASTADQPSGSTSPRCRCATITPPGASKTPADSSQTAGENTARADTHSKRPAPASPRPFTSTPPASSLPRMTRPRAPICASIRSKNDARRSRGSTNTTSTGRHAATMSPGNPAPDPTSTQRCPAEHPSR